jgi:hypothetical protein
MKTQDILQSSTDLWFCSFAILKGYKVAHYDQISKGKARYYFNMSDVEWKDLKLEFNNSDYSKFKQVFEGLKDLGY